MLSIAIVEDEDSATAVLTKCLEKYGKENAEAFKITRFGEAAELLKNYKPVYDIIFMDILLPRLNGMEASKQLRAFDKRVTLIFVTNMANFAVKGYEVDALDFIVKPVVYDSFAMKMDKAVTVVKSRCGPDIAIPMDGALKVIPSSVIAYIEVSRHNLVYHTQEGNYKTRGSLSDIEQQLTGENFIRCNVCYLVNLKFVTEVRGDDVTVGGDKLRISRAKKKEFMYKLTNYLGRCV